MKFYFAGRNHAFSNHSFTEAAPVRVIAGRRIRAATATTEGDAFPLRLATAAGPITSASASGDSAGGTARKVRSIFLVHFKSTQALDVRISL